MILLEDKQLAPFRKEYLEREKEIQRYIGVYLSGVVIVFGWIIGPQSKPLNDMALGNDGYNIYAFLIISVVNALFITFLIYKSLDVHDTTQFITVLAKPGSVYAFWENWRRSKHSATKPVRTLYFIALALLPTIMAVMMGVFAGSKIFSSEESLRNQLVEIENRRQASRIADTLSANQSLSALPTPPDVSEQLQRIKSVFRVAGWFFVLICGFHLIPFWFFYHNTVPTKKRWEAIAELKEARATNTSPCTSEALALADLIEGPHVTHQTGEEQKTIAEE